MRHLSIHNFGPLKDVELDIKDYGIFIGPQASGKSTITKLIYYFLSLKEDIKQYIIEVIANGKRINPHNGEINIMKKHRAKFVQLFGTTKHMNDFDILFVYNDSHSINLTLKEGYVKLNYSEQFKHGLSILFNKANNHITFNNINLEKDDVFANILIHKKFMSEITSDINAMVGNDESTIIYVPACRSLLATLSDYIFRLIHVPYSDSESAIPDSTLDYSSKSFIDRISAMKEKFTQSLDDMIIDKRKLSSQDTKIDSSSLDEVKKLIYLILKGEYRYSKNEERLYYNKKDYVKLSLSSSGQQESVWILQLIFYLVLENTKTTLLIEEPEAHLYPEAQKDIVSLISLFSNINGNKVIITTHSPYILTSINNLIYARKVGIKNNKEVSEIVPNKCWLDINKINAFFVQNGCISSIIDTELEQIQAEKIDKISNILNEQFDKLMNIEFL